MLRRSLIFAWTLSVAVLVCCAVLLSVARAWLPQFGAQRADVQRWVSEAIGRPVEIAGLDAEWRGLYPVLHLRDVRLLDPGGRRTLLHFAELRVAVDPYAALYARRVQVHALSVIGARLSVERRADDSIGITGLEEMPDAAAGSAVLGWLAAQPQLSLLRSEIRWHDARSSAAPLLFSAVDLSLANDGLRHRLGGAVRLPKSLGETLRVALDFTGDLAAPAQWSGALYVQGRALQLPVWLRDRDLTGLALSRGSADAELWGEFAGLRIARLEGRMALHNAQFAAQGAATLDELSGQFAWLRRDDGWRVDVEDLRVIRAGRAWPKSGFNVLARDTPDGARQIEAGFDFLRTQDIAAFTASGLLPAELRNPLAGLDVHGDARDLRLAVQTRNQALQEYAVRARLDTLSTHAWQRLPAVAGISGLLECTDQGGRLQLDSHDTSVELPRLFRLPLHMARLDGTLEWRRYAAEWRIQSDDLMVRNADVQTHTRFVLDLPGNAAPFLDLQTGFADGDVGAVSRYLPAHIMSESVVAWLDRALVSGRIASGGVLFHGRLADFPFDGRTGTFRVDVPVDAVVLDYQQGWPRIEGISAQVSFDGRSMTIAARSGRIYAAELGPTQVTIADLSRAELQIAGAARASNADLLRFVRETPLSAHYGAYLSGLTAQGDSHLSLTLNLPLNHHETGPRIAGRVDFAAGGLVLPEWGLALEELTGPLEFTAAGLSSSGMSARLLGHEARITARVQERGVDAGTTLELRGHAEIGALAKLYPAQGWRLLDGDGDVQAQLYFSTRADAPAQLRIESNLQGVRVRLPAPLGKAARESRTLRLAMPLSRAPRSVLLADYGDVLHAAFELPGATDKRAPLHGELRFGDTPAQLPETPGVRIAGELPTVDVESWRTALAAPAAGVARAPVPDDLDAFDMHVRELHLDTQTFHAVRLKAQRRDGQWQAMVGSDELTGEVQLPQRYPEGGPLVMNLDHLRIDADQQQDRSPPLDPRTLPALQINAKRFEYHGTDFGALQLLTTRTPEGMHVDKAAIVAPDLKTGAQGDWTVNQQAQISRFTIDIDAPQLGGLLGKFGYVGNIKDGQTTAHIRAEWPGSPARFALERLQGELHVNIKKGRFVDIEPGAGRVFGLLSINELQRRLRLDFSDLFKKGYSFDEINGDFMLSNGDAFTDNLNIKGPSARLDVTGRTGLVKRDYEQLITVTPHLTASLPIAGAIANPGIGAALFLAQKLLENRIDTITRYQYTVRGTWDKPVIERVVQPAPSGKK